jgi:flagellar hook assembly protein FlgD
LVASSSGSYSDPYAGFDLDAVSYPREGTAISSANNVIHPLINVTSYPNPVSSKLTIAYRVTNQVNPAIKIYSTTGKLVTSINPGERAPGNYKTDWNLTDRNGKKVPTGIYISVFETGTIKQINKIIVSK